MLVVSPLISIPLREFDFSFSRSSGPGGQNVNKVNTKVQLRWRYQDSPHLHPGAKIRFQESFRRRINNEGELLVVSQRFRDQGRNVADCLNKLKQMILSIETPPKKRRPTKVSKGAKQRRLNDKKQHSEKKQRRSGKIKED